MAVSTDYFNTPKVLDGGMGQDLFARGVPPVGTLWSASALIDPQYHGIVRDAHLDFIDAGADVIVTNTFTTRRTRLVENNIGAINLNPLTNWRGNWRRMPKPNARMWCRRWVAASTIYIRARYSRQRCHHA